MKKWFVLFGLVVGAAFSAPANAAFVFNTGVAADGTTPLTLNQLDQRYLTGSGATAAAAIANAGLSSATNAYTWDSTGGYPIPLTGDPGPWLSDAAGANSRWISPFQSIPGRDTAPESTFFAYTNTFDLTGLNAREFGISGKWAGDNSGAIYLNGVQVSPAMNLPSTGFNQWTDFNVGSAGFLPSGANVFNSGVNTLTFVIFNAAGVSGNPTGLRVEATGFVAPTNVIPAPAALGLFALGLPALGFIRRRLSR